MKNSKYYTWTLKVIYNLFITSRYLTRYRTSLQNPGNLYYARSIKDNKTANKAVKEAKCMPEMSEALNGKENQYC